MTAENQIPNTTVIKKQSNSKFLNTLITSFLKEHGIIIMVYELWISHSIGKIKVKIRFAHCKLLKAEQTHFPEQSKHLWVCSLHMSYFLPLEYLCF